MQTIITALAEQAHPIPAVGQNGRYAGMFTAQGVLRMLRFGSAQSSSFVTAGSPLLPVLQPASGVALQPHHTVSDALRAFQKGGEDAYPLLSSGYLMGMVSEDSILRHLQPPLRLTAGDLMTARPLVMDAQITVADAAARLSYGFRRMPVVNDNELVGVISCRTVLRSLSQPQAVRRLRTSKKAVSTIMERDPVTITPSTKIEHALQLMRLHGAGFLPVVNERAVRGVLTKRDILYALH